MQVAFTGEGPDAPDGAVAGRPPAAGAVEDSYPLLPLQAGLVYNSLRGPFTGVDVLQVVIPFGGPPDRAAWQEAWRRAMARHPALRTAFRFPTGTEPYQDVYRDIDVPIEWREITSSGQLDEFVAADRRREFDMSTAPLFRITGLCESHLRHTIVFSFHHAILDGRSMKIVFAETVADYAAIRTGSPLEFERRRPYRDFVAWWQKQDLTAAGAFWTDFLRGHAPAPVPLPGSLGDPVRPGARDRTSDPVSIELTLDTARATRLREAAGRAGVTLATLVNAAWAVLLSRYQATDDVVFATTRSCRYGSVEGADAMVGLLINTVPMRIRVHAGQTVGDLLADVARRAAAVREHQLAPLGDIWRGARLPAGQPETIVVFERERLHAVLGRVDIRLRDAVTVHWQPSFRVTLYVFDEPEPRIVVNYDRRRFAAAAADRTLRQVHAVLTGLAGDPDTRVADLGSTVEDQAQIAAWNDTFRPYPRDATIPERFAAHVAGTPDAVAVVDHDGARLTYAQLDARANRLAHLLRERGVTADSRVAVALPRGADLVVALLAVLKAGGAYVPLDPANPPARSALVLDDSGARLVLTTAANAASLPPTAEALTLDTLDLAGRPDTPPPCPAHPTSLAYLSYTSGSTGVPKGVAVPHRAVLRLVHEPTFATLGPGETLLQLAPVAFDASTLELWGSLLTGARLAIAPPGPLALPELAKALRDSGATTLWLTAGLFHQMAELDVGALSGVRQLLSGGDVLAPDAVRAALRARGGAPVVNGYGPTECTTFVSCHRMTDPDGVGDRVPIGRPIQQTAAYVLDGSMRPTPVGVPGELYVGGDGLARGYLGRPGLTAEKFVPDPFGTGPGGRLYRTGDLVRWRDDGVLEFLGRIDGQVKIRGFRIEPGEVEAVLRARPGVHQAVVVPHGEGEARHLVAYVTGDPSTVDGGALREHLARQLPEYLVPAAVLVLDTLPLNDNGKVDRSALPAPSASRSGVPAGAGPASPVEVRLGRIWREILGVEQVHGADDFFALGGNSLAATRLVFRVRDAFDVDLPLLRLYEAATLSACAATVEGLMTDTTAAPATGGITRRDRSAFRAARAPSTVDSPVVPATRVAAEPAPVARSGPAAPTWPDHLVPLASERWGMWRWVCLRSAGFPIGLHGSVADPALAEAADRLNASGGPESRQAYDAEFVRAERDLARALHAAATDPRFREAVAWQNRRVLETGIDSLVRRDPETNVRTSRHRRNEALVASYLQRYCAKNDTIGFFGPLGWVDIRDDVDVIDLRPAPPGALAGRDLYFEGWAIRAFAESYDEHLRPWLVPRRLPFVDVSFGPDGCALLVPFAPPVPVSPLEAHTFRLLDGVRTAAEVAAAVLATQEAGARDADEVYRALESLLAAGRIAWTFDVAPEDTRSESSVRARLATVTDPALREPALAALDELETARDRVAAAAESTVDIDGVARALDDLNETFTRLTGAAATRRGGQTYAGRTLLFEECLRVDDLAFGPGLLASLAEPLELVLEAARWYTAAGAALFHRASLALFRERVATTGKPTVPLGEFWMSAHDLIFKMDGVADPLERALQKRWADLLAVPAGVRRVERSSAELKDKVRKAFAVAEPGWPAAVQHSPDIMIAASSADAIAAGDFTWVLGEVHTGVNTLRYSTWTAMHPEPRRLGDAIAYDVRRPVVQIGNTAEAGGTPTRSASKLVGPPEYTLVFAYDTSGYDPSRVLFVGDTDIEETGGRLFVRRRGSADALPFCDVFADPLAFSMGQRFHVAESRPHTPRIAIDRLVIQRETWRFPARSLEFADITDERQRYLAARRWAGAHDLPRHVFVRATGEMKPIYADLSSLSSVDLLARAARLAIRNAGDAATVGVSEMLPTPDQLWLADDRGQRYTSELRVCCVDRIGRTD